MSKVSEEYRAVQRHARALLTALEKLSKANSLHEIPPEVANNALVDALFRICKTTAKGRPAKAEKSPSLNYLESLPRPSGRKKKWTRSKERSLLQCIDTERAELERAGRTVTDKDALRQLRDVLRRHGIAIANIPELRTASEKTLLSRISEARRRSQ